MQIKEFDAKREFYNFALQLKNMNRLEFFKNKHRDLYFFGVLRNNK